MGKGYKRLKRGDFNYMNQEWQTDGSVVITLTKRGDRKIYRLHVRNLGQPDEEVLSDEEVK